MKKFVLLILSLLLVATAATAQQKNRGKVSGKVLDAKTSQPIEFATVALLNTADSSVVAGDVTTANGSFAIETKHGSYLLRISFMGYNTYFHATPVVISAAKPAINLKTIHLVPSATMMEEVTITAERSMVEYQLDKRVINVDKNIVTGGGTATDVLENVPSVAIDNDGNVTLRGSTNVTVLINGRPYELLGSDLETLLEQIPASTVENVEIITNPSAKYDPEGMSGIINIKLKENTNSALGLNGIANLNVGGPLPFAVPDELPSLLPTTMASLNLNYSTPKLNLYFNLDGGQRTHGRQSTSHIRRYSKGITTSEEDLEQFGQHRNTMFSTKLGAEYHFDKQTSLLLSYQLRLGNRRRLSEINSNDLLHHNDSLSYTQNDTNTNRNLNHTVNLSFVRKFNHPDQQFTLDATYSQRHGSGDGWQQQEYTLFPAANWDNYYLRETNSSSLNHNINLQANYVHPFSDKLHLETGYEGRITSSDQDYDYFMTTYDASHNLDRIFDNLSSTHYVYQQQIHAIYATLGFKLFDNLSAQAGLRGEYSTVDGNDEEHPATEKINKNYRQIYPTLHLSYDISKSQSLQLSYSRRVRRPHMWDLNPYLNVREGSELSFGNPGLDPEFTNAFELSYNIGFNKINIFSSAYFRQTNNMMTRYGFQWDKTSAYTYSPWIAYSTDYDGYWATTWQNLNRGLNYGLEFIVDYQIAQWWKVNVSINLYQSYIEGTALLDNQDKNAFRASGKFSSFINLPDSWTVQFSGQYRAPFLDLQSEMLASYWADLAVKKDVLQKRGTINLRVGDVFHTGGFGHTTETEQLYRKSRSKRISPTVTVGFSYKINNGIRQRQQPEADEDDSEQ